MRPDSLSSGAVTPAFADALWALNLNASVQVVGNLMLTAFRPPGLRRLSELLFSVAGLIGAVVMYQVFPFELSRFGAWVTPAARALLLLAIVGTSIAILVNLVLLAGGGRMRAARE